MKKIVLIISTLYFLPLFFNGQCGPAISCPANISVNATSGCGAVVTYTATAVNLCSSGSTTVWSEDFQTSGAGWTMNVNTGTNANTPNSWEVNDSEGGVAPPGCGAASNGDKTMHITCTSSFCGSLITGAVYNAAKTSNKRTESPVISTVGFSSLTLSFDFISNGDALLDNASVMYNDGLGWQVLTTSIKSAICGNGQGLWSVYTSVLPVSCSNNPNLKIGINWTNNNDNIGTDPSVAINNMKITAPGSPLPTVTFNIASGSLFAIGTTAVTATATDALLATATCTFNVIVSANTFSQSPIICSGQNFSVGANIYSAPGNYIDTLTSGLGCDSIVLTNLSVIPSPTLFVSSTLLPIECVGSIDTLVVTGANSYLWSTSSLNDTLFITNSVAVLQWTVVGTALNGCTDSETINITSVSTPILVNVNLNAIDTLCFTAGVVSLANLGSPVGGTWTGTGVSGLTFNTALAGLGNHQVTYTVVNTNGCISSTSGNINVNGCLGLENSFEKYYSIYPNPSNGNFILDVNSIGNVQIFNSLGEIILNQKVSIGKNNLNLECYESAVYFLLYSNGTKFFTKKICIEK